MSSFSDNALDKIRMDYLEKDKESYLYRFFSENPSYAGLDEKKIKKKAEDLMYNLGCPVSAARKIGNAQMRLDAFEREKKSLSDSFLDAGKNKEKLRKLKEKEKELNDNIEKKKQEKEDNKGRKSANKSVAHKNTALRLIDGWMSEYGTVHDEAEKIDIESCEKMYELLKRNKDCKRVRMPLVIDKDTGGGIYIVGNDVCPKRLKKLINVNAQLAIIVPYQADVKEGFRMRWDVGYDCVRSALDFYENAKKFCLYQMWLELPDQPVGTPEEFRKYFDPNNEMFDDPFYSEEDLDETRKQFLEYS